MAERGGSGNGAAGLAARSGVRRVILLCRAARSFAVGVLQVALPLALKSRGFNTSQIFAVLSAGLAGATAQNLLVGRCVRRLARLHLLSLLTGGMAAAAFLLSRSGGVAVALCLAFCGALCTQPNIAAQAPLEHATLSDLAKSTDERTAIFGWYNALSSFCLCLGALAAGAPLPEASPAEGRALAPGFRGAPKGALAAAAQLGGAAAVLLGAALAYLAAAAPRGAPAAEEALLQGKDLPLSHCRHLRRILGLASLFAVDSWAGGMALQSVMTYWLATQYGASEAQIGVLFAVGGVLGTASYAVAVWLGKRIGLVNTMVFTHLPANVTLVVTPYMPNVELVYMLFLVRAFLCQMDVPARESFMMGVVDDDERIACSSFITTTRAMACVLGPLAGAALWTSFGPAAPLVACGSIKCVYDLSLLVVFRAVKPS